MKIKEKVLKEAHEGYVCTGNGDPELCCLCECIRKSRNLTLAEVGKVIDDWNLLGMAIEEGRDTNKKVLRTGKKDIKELKQKLGIK